MVPDLWSRRDLLQATAAIYAGKRLTGSLPLPKSTVVKTGLESLIEQDFAPLRDKRVGLITNPTGVTSGLRSSVDALASAPGVRLTALFGPEHGVRGDVPAGKSVDHARDSRTGVPVFSLYGRVKKPTTAMLGNLDALVFDIQDIGSRSYTYITTMGLCMEAAAENRLPFYVLDRPNPIGGDRVEGNLLDLRFKSAVGAYPIPYCHGLTVGELARMINEKGWMASRTRCRLTVIPMRGYRRAMRWEETGLPWVPTSPHLPHSRTAFYYAATGIAGELPSLSIGVGYTLPFELAGAPGAGAERFADELNRRGLKGVRFRAVNWRPFYAAYQGQMCGGAQIYLTDPAQAELTRVNFEILDALRKVAPSRPLFGTARNSDRMFDLVCGTDVVRRQFLAGRSAAQIWTEWNEGSRAFRSARQPFLLYT
jgi:uncharacterized protein YbbC (DUF1343 family)